MLDWQGSVFAWELKQSFRRAGVMYPPTQDRCGTLDVVTGEHGLLGPGQGPTPLPMPSPVPYDVREGHLLVACAGPPGWWPRFPPHPQPISERHGEAAGLDCKGRPSQLRVRCLLTLEPVPLHRSGQASIPAVLSSTTSPQGAAPCESPVRSRPAAPQKPCRMPVLRRSGPPCCR